MILTKLYSRLKLNKHVKASFLSSKSVEVVSETESLEENIPGQEFNSESTPKEKYKRKRLPSKKHLLELDQLFSSNSHIEKYKALIPEKLLFYIPYLRPDYIYLVCPQTAKQIAKHVLLSVSKNNDQVIAEVNPGFAFITKELIKRGIPIIRLYEHSTDFQQLIKQESKKLQSHVELFNKDLFKLHIYSYMDRNDLGERVASLLAGVPKRSWVEEPVMTVIGTMNDLSFIKYLIKSIVLQRDIATYGRIQILAVVFPQDWAMLNSTKEDNLFVYKPWTILFRIFFEVRLIDKFPRKLFLPWQSRRIKKTPLLPNLDLDSLYLVEINMKKDWFLNAEQFVPFFCFVKTLLGSGKKRIIPTCEKWVPGCGVNLMLPKLKHVDYFEDMDIYTLFRELTPEQIVAVFREIAAMPEYKNSPFTDMVEQEMMKSETINSDIHATHKKIKRSFTDSDLCKQ